MHAAEPAQAPTGGPHWVGALPRLGQGKAGLDRGVGAATASASSGACAQASRAATAGGGARRRGEAEPERGRGHAHGVKVMAAKLTSGGAGGERR